MKKGLLMLVSLIVILSSCEKEEGLDGKDGNANVKTEIIEIYGYEWEHNDPFYGVDKSSSLLTADIIRNGSSHLYLESSEDVWIALPYSTMGFGVGIGEVGIFTEGDVINQTTTLKLVVISGIMQAKSSNVNFNDYNEVKEVFNIR